MTRSGSSRRQQREFARRAPRALLVVVPTSAPAAVAEESAISVEIKKPEPKDQADGVAGRNLKINLAPLAADKSTIKLFDLDGKICHQVGSFLIDDVLERKAAAGTAGNCLDLAGSSLTKVQLTK